MYKAIDDYNRPIGLLPKARTQLEGWVDRLILNG